MITDDTNAQVSNNIGFQQYLTPRISFPSKDLLDGWMALVVQNHIW